MSPLAGRGDVVFGGGVAKAVGDPVQRFDLQDEIFQTGYGTDNFLSMSGGREGTSYYLSAGWRDDEGTIRGQGYSKWSGLVKLTQDITETLQVSASANYLQTETDYIPEGEQTQGVLTTIIFTPTSFNPLFDPELGRFPYSPILGTNPLDVIENWTTRVDVGRFIGNLQASWRPTGDLSFNALFGVDDSGEENVFFQPRFATGARFTGLIQNPVRSVTRYTGEATANHEMRAGEALDFVTTLGFRGTSDNINIVRAGASDIPPGQTTVGGATQFASQYIEELNTISGYVQERVGVNDRLFVTGGLNLEAASAFGEDERLQLFPRVGLSYLVDQEPWWEDSRFGDILSTLRLRASYGETGGQPPEAYAIFDSYADEPFAGRPGLRPSTRAGNPNLEPERQREWEGGFDLAMFSDRVGVEFTYYDQETSNLVLPVPLPSSSGLGSQLQNIGVLSNRGLELSLNTINVQRPDFSWSTRLSYATNRNRVEQLLTNADTLVVGYLNAVVEGQPVGVFYGGFYARDDAGNILLNDKGIPLRAHDPRTNRFANRLIGDPNPDFTAALSNTVQVGDNLQFDMLLDGRFGNDVANFTRRITEFFGAAAVVEREITGEVPVGFYTLNGPRIGLYEEYIEDGSFVKLREVALRYTLAGPWLRRSGADAVTLRLAGRNLYTWTDYSGLDPEVNLFSASTVARGVDFATSPIPRSVVLGVSFTF
jgi:outer membrane receptor protein involved in Fe transport